MLRETVWHLLPARGVCYCKYPPVSLFFQANKQCHKAVCPGSPSPRCLQNQGPACLLFCHTRPDLGACHYLSAATHRSAAKACNLPYEAIFDLFISTLALSILLPFVRAVLEPWALSQPIICSWPTSKNSALEIRSNTAIHEKLILVP